MLRYMYCHNRGIVFVVVCIISSMIMRRLAQFVRLHLSRVCVRLLASVCVYVRLSHVGRLISRLLASVCVCLRLCASARVCVRLLASVCICLASVCVCSRLCASVSRLCASARVCVRLRLCASVSRLCASVVLSRVCLRLLVGTGSFYASVVIQRVQRWGELAQVFAICLASYYPLAVFYNVLMLKYPSHHLIYVFYHPMPIMPLY